MDWFGETPNIECVYTFDSTFAQEDVEYTLVEVLSNDIETEIVSKQKVGNSRSANHLFKVKLSIPEENWMWPRMTGVQKDVIQKLERGLPFAADQHYYCYGTIMDDQQFAFDTCFNLVHALYLY